MESKKILRILCIITFIVFSNSVIALTGENTEQNINITRGQISIAPINTISSTIYTRGAAQYITSLGNNTNIDTRFGILRTNNQPFQPTLINPSNNSYINYSLIELSWNTTDPNDYLLTSLLELFNDSTLTNNYHINHTISTISYNITIAEDNITLYWQTRVNNSEVNSSFSELRTFVTDYTYPTAPVLISPENNSRSTATAPNLEWEASTEENLQNYTIETCLSIACISSTVVATTTNTLFISWPEDKILGAGEYFWRVRVTDKANNQNLSGLFNYTVEASTEVEIETILGERSSGEGIETYTLNIISPPDITIYANDSIEIPLIVMNPARMVTLRNINLTIESDSEDLSSFLGISYIEYLRPKEQIKVPLKIVTHTAPGIYALTIKAEVKQPYFEDKIRIVANLVERGAKIKAGLAKQLSYAKYLVEGNPECLDLMEYIQEAEASIREGHEEQAQNLIDNAIKTCQKLISQKKSPFKKSFWEIPYLMKENKNIIIITAESLGFMLFIVILYHSFKKK